MNAEISIVLDFVERSVIVIKVISDTFPNPFYDPHHMTFRIFLKRVLFFHSDDGV